MTHNDLTRILEAMPVYRTLLQIIFAMSAVVGFVLFLYGNAVLMKVGVVNPAVARWLEAFRLGWLALGAGAFGLLFLPRLKGKFSHLFPLGALLAGVAGVAVGPWWFPAQFAPAPPAPPVVSTNSAGLDPQDWVLGVAIDGQAKAYPWAMIQRQYVVNDRLGDTPVVIMYCISCNSSLAYRAKVQGRRLNFGVVGVYAHETILHDEATGSWWREDGSVVAGPLKGSQLEQLPAALLPWADWQAMYPDTQLAME